jgi:hypothetical protein
MYSISVSKNWKETRDVNKLAFVGGNYYRYLNTIRSINENKLLFKRFRADLPLAPAEMFHFLRSTLSADYLEKIKVPMNEIMKFDSRSSDIQKYNEPILNNFGSKEYYNTEPWYGGMYIMTEQIVLCIAQSVDILAGLLHEWKKEYPISIVDIGGGYGMFALVFTAIARNNGFRIANCVVAELPELCELGTKFTDDKEIVFTDKIPNTRFTVAFSSQSLCEFKKAVRNEFIDLCNRCKYGYHFWIDDEVDYTPFGLLEKFGNAWIVLNKQQS